MADGNQGSTLLGEIAAQGGNPTPPPPPAPGTAAEALQNVQDGPPEWVPAKFWDPDKKAPRVEDLGRGYKNLEQLLGREKVPVPTSEDDTEGWERWYKAHGRPEKPDEYEFKRPDKLPDDLPYDEDTEKSFRNWAHQNGLNKKQANSFYDAYVKHQIDRNLAYHNMQKELRANAETALRRELGNKYEGFAQQTSAVYKKYADPEFAEFLAQTGLGNDPRMVRVFGKIAADLGGETRLNGRPQQQVSPADIEKSISEFRSKHHAALFDPKHPDNERLSKELGRLYDMKYPEQGA